ncbi:unnamed protein product, partial [Mesorhabditis spiculigera]
MRFKFLLFACLLASCGSQVKDRLLVQYTCAGQHYCDPKSMRTFTETGGLVVCNDASVDSIYEASSTFLVHKVKAALWWGYEGITWRHGLACWDQYQDLAPTNESSDFLWYGDHCQRTMVSECVNCPAGWQYRPPKSNSPFSCVPSHEDGWLMQQLRDAPYERLSAMEVMPTPRYCPEGFFERTNWQLGELCRPCPKNCLRCMFPDSCTMCQPGFLPTFNNSHCDPLLPPGKTSDYSLEEILTPRPYCDSDEFLLYSRCMPCQEYLPHCVTCQATTKVTESVCTRCERGYLLSKDKHRQRCVQITECIECARGLYKLLDRNEHRATCHYECPPGTYPTNKFPFYCRRCHYTCRTCWGPSNLECHGCYFFAFIDEQSLLLRCGVLPGDPPSPDVTKFTPDFIAYARKKLEAGFSVSSRPQDIFGVLFTHRFYRTISLMRITTWLWSELWESIEERGEAAKDAPLWGKYPKFCRDNKCLDHCDPATATLFHPCPTCLPGYYKDMRGYCIPDCPDGSFADDKLGRCILCHEPVACKRCTSECKADYELLEPLPGVKICTLRMRPSQDTLQIFRKRHTETGTGWFLYFFAMLVAYVCSQFGALYVALFLGKLDKAELICWGYDHIVSEAALAHLAELLVLKRSKSKSGSVGSGSWSRRATRRGSAATIESYACNTRYDSSSSNGSTRRRKRRVFIRPNIGAKAFRSWRKRQKAEKKAQGLPVSVTQDSLWTSGHSEPTQETAEKPAVPIPSQRSVAEDATSGDRLNSDPLSSAAASQKSACEEPEPHPNRSSPVSSWR